MVAGCGRCLPECFHVEEQHAGRVVHEHRPVSAVADHHLSAGVAADSPRRRQVCTEARHELTCRREHLDVLGAAVADDVAARDGRRCTCSESAISVIRQQRGSDSSSSSSQSSTD